MSITLPDILRELARGKHVYNIAALYKTDLKELQRVLRLLADELEGGDTPEDNFLERR